MLLGALLLQPGLAAAASLTAVPGQPVRVSANLTLGQTLSGANVILFVVSSSGKYTGVNVSTVANFTAGKSIPVSATFSLPTSLATGTYSVSAGIYSRDWTELRWTTNVAGFQVAAATSTGAAELTWVAPTQNTDGSVLTNLAGYKIHYGTSAGNLTQTVTITNPGLTAYTLSDLPAGAFYFAVTAYSTAGVESALSGVVATTL